MGRSQRAPARPARRSEPAGKLRPYPLLIFLALTTALFGNTLMNGFVHDDKPLVVENRLIRDVQGMTRIFASGYWTTRDQSVPELYRPLTVFSLALNRLTLGAGPFGYHLVNVLLHGCVCWLVFLLVQALGGSRWLAWAAGLIFAVHPVHVEAVAPVVGRSELLAAGFGLLALLFHCRARATEKPAARLLLGASLCYLAALLSKESAIVLPLLAWLTDLALPAELGAPSRRAVRLPYYFYAAVTGAYLLARVAVLGAVAASLIHPLDNPLVAMDRGSAARTALVAGGRYLLLMAWPWKLSADYAGSAIHPATRWLDLPFLASLTLLAILVGVAVTQWRRGRLAPYGMLFFFVAWLPISNLLFIIGTPLAERLLYLPSVGLAIALGALLARGHRVGPRLTAAVLALLLLAGSARTFARNRVWHDDGSFAFATAANAPTSAKAQFNLGVFLEEHSDPGGAAAAYARAAELAPDWADAHFNLAGVLSRTSRLPEAVLAYRSALGLRPDDPRIVLNLGYALYQARRHEEAVQLYQDFLTRRGDSPAILNSLGANLTALGKMTEATRAYRAAVSLAPNETGYRLNLARALESAGDAAGAVAEYRAILDKEPENAMALRGLGMLLYRSGEPRVALELLRQASDRTPGGLDPEAAGVLTSLQQSPPHQIP
jgi:tetratricopeptide (TPR) repeat protein